MARQLSIAANVGRRRPIAGERRIEHLAQPWMITGSLTWRQDAAIDTRIVVGTLGSPRERAARHHDQPAAHRSIASICSS